MSFSEIVDAVDDLTLDEQEMFIKWLKRRIRERRREELVQDVRQVEEEYRLGLCQVMTVDEIMRDLEADDFKSMT